MLSNLKVHATIPASDLERAKKFYGETLGLKQAKETGGGVFFESAGGTRLAVYPTPDAGKSPNTVAGWSAKDLDAEVVELKKRGVKFEEYDLPGFKTVDGIATTPTGKAAWFKDSEGNILGIVQFAKPE